MIHSIKHIIESLPFISLDELGAVAFDSRIDTKFVMHQDKLPSFLNKIKNDLVVLQIGEKRMFQYENVYSDSPEFIFFKKHHSGFGNRSKVRVRKYSNSGPYFFEVKNKTNKGKTNKYRVPVTSISEYKNSSTRKELLNQTGFTFENLSQLTEINYKRITFSNLALTEKLTVDFDMEARNTNGEVSFDNLVIVEVKQIKYSSRSPFITALKELKTYSTSFSKYCTSVAILNTDIKHNRFLPMIKTINKIARA